MSTLHSSQSLFPAQWGGTLIVALAALTGCVTSSGGLRTGSVPYRTAASADLATRADLSKEFIYFLMVDRFANGNLANDLGDYQPTEGVPRDADSEVLKHGFCPTRKQYYHGGDLAGLAGRLDYIRGLGATAVWLSPVLKNKPTRNRGNLDDSAAAYHGYYPIDFTRVDPHFGSDDEFKGFVDKAHSLGMKVFLDVVANHTADIIHSAECESKPLVCGYRDRAQFPYKDSSGVIFDDRAFIFAYRDGRFFPTLSLSSFPYTPEIDPAFANSKQPSWLNDPTYYHNRGNTTYSGEDSFYGDFSGLDDLFTEHPRVVRGLIDIYKDWTKRFRVDGFRFDAAKHMYAETWSQIVPELESFAKHEGIPNFFMFGEVLDSNPDVASRYTSIGRMPAVLDFGFQGAASAVFASGQPTDILNDIFERDDFYTDADNDASTLPTFLGNHDIGRVGAAISRDNPNASPQEKLTRSRLAHALLFTSRGIPIVYYGDEQGMTGVAPLGKSFTIDFQNARQDMFATRVPEFLDRSINQQLGTSVAPAGDKFVVDHPLAQAIRSDSQLRRTNLALSKGVQFQRYSSNRPGGDIYAFSRIADRENRENIVVFNSSPSEARSATFATFHPSGTFDKIYPSRSASPQVLRASPTGSITVSMPPLDFAVYRAASPLVDHRTAIPEVTIVSPSRTYVNGAFWIGADLSFPDFASVDFFVREPGSAYRFLGRDHQPPYRVRYDGTKLEPGSEISVLAVSRDYLGRERRAEKAGIHVDSRSPRVVLRYQNGNQRKSVFAISSLGQSLTPQPVTSQGIAFEFAEGETERTFIFETREPGSNSFRFDRPVRISLQDHVYQAARTGSDGRPEAVLYANNAGEIGSNPNDVASMPPVLPFDDKAPNPYATAIYWRGTMNGWTANLPMTYVGNYTFRAQAFPRGGFEFKFADVSWTDLNFGGPFGAEGLSNGSGSTNLSSGAMSGNAGGYAVWFFAFPAASGSKSGFTFWRLEGIAGEGDAGADAVAPAHR